EENPRVIVAREKLRQAQDRLAKQIKGLRSSLTTDQVADKTKLNSLRATHASLLNKISEAQSRLPLSRDLSIEFTSLQNELGIAVSARKATVAEAARLRMNTVSAQSRLSVVDTAIPAEYGSPGLMRIILYSLILAGLVVMAWFAVT